MDLTTQPFLLSAIVQASFYIVYLIFLVFALRWLLCKEEGWTVRSCREINWFMLATTIIIFVFTTGGTVNSALLALAFSRLYIDGGMMLKKLVISNSVIETTTFLIIDAVLIYRCWTVYQRSWRAIFIPVLLWLANIVLMALLGVYASTSFNDQSQYEFLQGAKLFYSGNFLTNLYTTSAIVYRVRRIANANNNRTSLLYRVARIVAGTGMLYAASSLANLVAAVLMLKNLIAYLVCNTINFSMAGITFNLLLIRVGQLRADIEMDVCGSTPDANGNVVLSTLQFGVPSISTNDSSVDLESGNSKKHNQASGFEHQAFPADLVASQNTFNRPGSVTSQRTERVGVAM